MNVVETELKFQVPAGSRKSVQRAIATTSARSIRLQARYYDTPDRRLAGAGLALRLRMEGPRWVQALKGAGTSALHRLEHEVQLEASDAEPQLDLARHAGTPAAQALAEALGDGAEGLRVVYETRVLRTRRSVRSAGAVIELAFDVGEVVAGDRSLPLCEIEFELKRGPLQGLLALAAQWVQRHRLWLDVRSKAERGDRLARGVDAGPAVQARRPVLRADMSSDTALRTIVGACLAQVLPNAADVAAGAGTAEHVHQLRVGLRRLRSALRVFGDGATATESAWASGLTDLFARLGVARDRDVLVETVLPELQASGAPLTELPPAVDAADAGEALRGVACNRLLLELISFAEATPPDDAGQQVPFGKLARSKIRRMRRRLKADAAAFTTLDDAGRHHTRRRVKRLRYSLEFVASLHSSSTVEPSLATVRNAQDVLGRYNDLAIAERAFRAQADKDPHAWFAVGWLVARRAQLVPDAAQALKALAEAPRLRRKRK